MIGKTSYPVYECLGLFFLGMNKNLLRSTFFVDNTDQAAPEAKNFTLAGLSGIT